MRVNKPVVNIVNYESGAVVGHILNINVICDH